MCDAPKLSRNSMTRSCSLLLVVMLSGLLANASFAQSFEPPLSVPAMQDERLASSMLVGVAQAEQRLVAVGLRGGIIVSTDQGKNWIQAKVPVSTDLVAVTFPTAMKGWAVGHGGVVLHSEDGGLTWIKQLDGFQAAKLAIDFYTRNPEHIEDAESFLNKEQSFASDDETQPFLDVFFTDERHGFVVGTFNRIFETRDGGESWTPLMHMTNNPDEWHFYSVTGADGVVYLGGERGSVWRLDEESKHFLSIDTTYNGALFGVNTDINGQIYAYGMRGSLFRSTDQGQNWQSIAVPFGDNISNLISLGNDQLLLIGQGGEVARSEDGGQTFELRSLENPMPYYDAVLLNESRLVLVGALGVRIENI